MFKHVDCCSGHETGMVFLDGSLEEPPLLELDVMAHNKSRMSVLEALANLDVVI